MNGFEPPTSCRNMCSNQLSYITFIYIKQIPRFADKRLTDLVLQRYGLTINHSIISLRSPPTSVIPFGMCRLPKHHFTNMSKNSSLLFPVSLQGQAQRPDWVPDNRRFGLTLVRVIQLLHLLSLEEQQKQQPENTLVVLQNYVH